jgi:DNA ligase-1
MHPLQPFFFDVLHIDGEDLHDQSLAQRRVRLEQVVPDSQRPFSQVVSTHDEAEAVWTTTLEAGHEGVVVKSLHGPWEAGRRGAGWIKVKPRHTFDLVVLAVEWGSGRRRGHLSNIHLGARTDDGFVMVGKTFKGMTDAMLAWQTARFLELKTHREGHVVYVEPVQVVEIAIDGLQRSRRYPGGVALRFARVLGYRQDKSAEQADTLETLKAPFGVS